MAGNPIKKQPGKSRSEAKTVLEEIKTKSGLQLLKADPLLADLLKSLYIPMLIIGSDFKVRWHTPLAEKLFGISFEDLGKSVFDLKMISKIQDMKDLVKETIRNGTVGHKEMRGPMGRWYMMWARPYKRVDGHIEGAILIFIDIDQEKRYSFELEQIREALLATLEELDIAKTSVEDDRTKYEALLANIGEGVVAIDVDRQIFF